MKHIAAISALFCILVGCSDGPVTHHQEKERETPAPATPSETRIDAKPTPYENVNIAGKLSRTEYGELADVVLKHRPFKLRDGSYDWYTPAIIHVVVTDDGSRAVAMTSFKDGGGNVVTLERKSEKDKWRIVLVTKWTR